MTKPPTKMKTKLIRVTNLYDVTVKQFYAYVRNLHRHIRMQNAKIRRLRRKIVGLKTLRRQKPNVEEEVEAQDEDEGEDFMKALERAEAQQAQETQAASEPLNVKAFVDDIKKTAQEFDYQNRYIYEPTSGLYYDPETGYYYNAIYGLHYDGQKGCYLKYNETTQKYDFYSQVIPEESLEKEKPKTFQKKRKPPAEDEREDRERRRERRQAVSRSRSRSRSRGRDLRRRKGHRRRRSRSSRSYHSVSSRSSSSSTDEVDKKKRRRKREKEKAKKQKKRKDKRSLKEDSDDENKEEGELDSSSGRESDRSERRVILIDSSGSERGNSAVEVDLDKYADKHSDISRKYPPSLRLVVQESNVATVKQGSLFIITCKGGSLGREGDHDVIIPDINVSKYHLKFIYNDLRGSYQLLDLGSRNGTLLNGTRMAPTMQESDTFDIVHGDVIELNRTKLLCHIHDGSYTCGNCEPGLLMESTTGGDGDGLDDNRIMKPVSHKEGLKLLQKRYGLEDEKYVEPTGSGTVVDYNDRAAHRRKVKGSSNEHAKTQKASVNQQISSENKGFKMLSKLGWSEGKSLGKNDQGLKEPIPMTTNVGTSGLGSRSLVEPTTGPDAAKKMIWQMTQERYKACADVKEDSKEDAKKDATAGVKVASLDQQISSENRGFQMLAKLGWNEGESLGKEGGDGLMEPIKLLSNVGTSGLGSKPLKKPGTNAAASGKKKTIWKKKQSKCSATKLFEASDSE